MAFSINDIKAQLTGGGYRPNLFQVQITNPANGSADLKVPFMVQSTQTPASELGTIEVPYFGRTIKFAGDRTYSPWAVNVINDEDHKIKNAMEDWSNQINKFERNIRTLVRYKSQAQVTQFAKDGSILRVYQFNGLFPSVIGGIDLDWANNNTYSTFQIEFQYDNWEVISGPTGNSGGK